VTAAPDLFASPIAAPDTDGELATILMFPIGNFRK